MKREFVINRHGKDYVLYAGLLDEAHQLGLKGIRTQLLQVPTAQNGNVAICLAEVTMEKGTFTGIGDADPGNVNRQMVNVLIRMAETRAKARALRDAVNVGMVAIEELAESAPESIMLEDEPAAAPASNGPPARIVSLASVRQQTQQAAPGPAGPAPMPPPAPLAPPAPAVPPAHAVNEAPATLHSVPPAADAPFSFGPPPASISAAPASQPPAAARPATSRAPLRGGSGVSGGPAKPAAEAPPAPATQTQLETIAKLARSVGRAVPTDGLTRAAASELIARLSEERYGARRAP